MSGEIVGELHFPGDVRGGSAPVVDTPRHGLVRAVAASYDPEADRTTVHYGTVGGAS